MGESTRRTAEELCERIGIFFDMHPAWLTSISNDSPRYIHIDPENNYKSEVFLRLMAQYNYYIEHSPTRDKHAQGIAEHLIRIDVEDGLLARKYRLRTMLLAVVRISLVHAYSRRRDVNVQTGIRKGRDRHCVLCNCTQYLEEGGKKKAAYVDVGSRPICVEQSRARILHPIWQRSFVIKISSTILGREGHEVVINKG